MQKNHSNFQTVGICHRLFNFIMNSLIAQGLKRIAVGRSSSHDPIKENKENGEECLLLPAKKRLKQQIASSEIVVEFCHAHGLENWTTFEEQGSLGEPLKKDSPLLNGDQNIERKGGERRNIIEEKDRYSRSSFELLSRRGELPVIQEKGNSYTPCHPHLHFHGKPLQEIEISKRTGGRGGKKSVRFEGSSGKEDYERIKNIGNEKLGVVVMEQPEGTKIKPPVPPRLGRPLLSVAPNINELADAFIRSRKEAMRMNNGSLDQIQQS